MVGNLSDDNMFFDPYPTTTRLVLYDDGQMIIAGKEPYKQKVLSSGEINRFLSKLETLGFYSLESNQKHDPTDKLYDYGNDYQESFDGVKDCILVNADRSRNLCVYEPDQQFLIPEMKNILKYLEEYKPVGMTPYYPDRIFLSIRAADPSSDTLPANAIPWDKHFPSLETAKPRVYTSDTLNAIVYVDGDMAKKIYMFFLSSDGSGVFTQNGKEYIVYMDVILPHEKITNNHQ